jgi:hypothetical protein
MRVVIEYKMSVLTFSTTFVGNTSHYKKNWATYDQNVYWTSCKFRVILVRFEWNLHFVDRYSTNNQITNFIKIRPVTAELFHADRQRENRKGGRTDIMNLIATFGNFAKAPKKKRYCDSYGPHYTTLRMCEPTDVPFILFQVSTLLINQVFSTLR